MVLLALDLMAADEDFTKSVRQQVAAETDIPADAICVNCSHSHNAPVAAKMLGVGDVNPEYVAQVARLSADAIIQAWRDKKPARLSVGSTDVAGFTFNRSRKDGPVDTRLSVLRADSLDGKPFAMAFNYHTHINAHLDADPRAISRDLPGEVIDQIENRHPGVTALFLQGTCGDVMLRPEFTSTERSFEPGRAIAKAVLEVLENCRPVKGGRIRMAKRTVKLPTRRWTREELLADREEARHRLETGDTRDWLNGFAKVIVTYPDRLPQRYGGSVEKTVAAVSRFGMEWTDAILPTLETRPEFIETEVQAFCCGDVWFIAHSTELFATLGLAVRGNWPHADLFMLGYANGCIGYLPDAYDIERKSYAANQSPKFTGRFPFIATSGDIMVAGMLETLDSLSPESK
jgi:hypothetical protein